MEVTNAPDDVSLDELMELLRKLFGRPQTVVPILIKQVSRPDSFTADYAGLQHLNQRFFKGADALKHYLGDSLLDYLMYSATMMFSPKLKAEWDQHVVHNGIKPSMEELRMYISARLLQTSATDTPVSTPSASAQVAAGSTSSPSPSSKSSKSRSPFKCVVCEEHHGLLHCPTFIGYDVDKRNKTVREKRLCINCFSDSHGFKSCPYKFTCKTCNQKHHTLLHKDRPGESSADSLAVAASTTNIDVSVPQARPSFPNRRSVLHIQAHCLLCSAEDEAHQVAFQQGLYSELALPQEPATCPWRVRWTN